MILTIRRILIYNNHNTLRRLLDNQYWHIMQSVCTKKASLSTCAQAPLSRGGNQSVHPDRYGSTEQIIQHTTEIGNKMR